MTATDAGSIELVFGLDSSEDWVATGGRLSVSFLTIGGFSTLGV